MKQIIIIFLTIGNCQQLEQFFSFNPIPLQKIKELEKQYDSEQQKINTPIYVATDYLPKSQQLNLSPYPLIYVRKDKSFDLISKVDIMYHYSESDSSLRLITYTWDSRNFGDRLKDINSDHDKNLDRFINKYNSIEADITSMLGTPLQKDQDIKKMQEKDYGKWLEKSAKWQKGKTVVELKLIFTQGVERLGTHSIRVKVFWIG